MPVISALLLLFFQVDPFTAGLAAFHQGDYNSAERLFENARNDPRARVFLALTHAATSRCSLAEPQLKNALAGLGDQEVRRLAGLGLVQCYLSQSRFEDAAAVLAAMRRDFPDDADVLYQTARMHMRAWNDVLYQMFRKTPASFRVNQISAEIFELQGNYEAAISEYKKAIEKNPKAINLHFRLGRAILMQSHAPEALAEALKEFEAELALNPYDAVAEYQIAQILQVQQKPAEAQRRYERALALQPQFPEALLALGKLHAEARRWEQAIPLLERAVDALPKSESARYGLMMAYRNAGRISDAEKQKAELEKLQRPPEGEFTEFLRRLGEGKRK